MFLDRAKKHLAVALRVDAHKDFYFTQGMTSPDVVLFSFKINDHTTTKPRLQLEQLFINKHGVYSNN